MRPELVRHAILLTLASQVVGKPFHLGATVGEDEVVAAPQHLKKVLRDGTVRRKHLLAFRRYREILSGLLIPPDLNLQCLATPLGVDHQHMMRRVGTEEGRSQHHVTQRGGKTNPGQGTINDRFHSMH
ncbi:hypothetical protein D9M69_529370 [compost metagenome]